MYSLVRQTERFMTSKYLPEEYIVMMRQADNNLKGIPGKEASLILSVGLKAKLDSQRFFNPLMV